MHNPFPKFFPSASAIPCFYDGFFLGFLSGFFCFQIFNESWRMGDPIDPLSSSWISPHEFIQQLSTIILEHQQTITPHVTHILLKEFSFIWTLQISIPYSQLRFFFWLLVVCIHMSCRHLKCHRYKKKLSSWPSAALCPLTSHSELHISHTELLQPKA